MSDIADRLATEVIMSDIADRVAREVMGWRKDTCPEDDDHFPWWTNEAPSGHSRIVMWCHEWDPEHRGDHAFMVLDRMYELGWNYRVERGQAWFWPQIGEFPRKYTAKGSCDEEAISLAAIAAREGQT